MEFDINRVLLHIKMIFYIPNWENKGQELFTLVFTNGPEMKRLKDWDDDSLVMFNDKVSTIINDDDNNFFI